MLLLSNELEQNLNTKSNWKQSQTKGHGIDIIKRYIKTLIQ